LIVLPSRYIAVLVIFHQLPVVALQHALVEVIVPKLWLFHDLIPGHFVAIFVEEEGLALGRGALVVFAYFRRVVGHRIVVVVCE
jgi:hypothetical protein